jgi:hypothetical protein
MAARQDVINWVSRAWQLLHEDVIEHSFKYTGISQEVEGNEEH